MSSHKSYHPTLPDFLDTHSRVVCLRIAEVIGSAPREIGAFMLVAESGKTSEQAGSALFATIGGGQMEQTAIDAAKQMLKTDNPATETLKFALNPKSGQCCGGQVVVEAKFVNPALKTQLLKDNARMQKSLPSLYIFGAGHVGRALVAVLDGLPFNLHLVDTRAEQLALCHSPNPTKHHTPLPEVLIDSAPNGSSFVITTHEHSLDFLIAGAALKRIDAPYIGMIGSVAKKHQFDKWFGENRLICPIGAVGLGDKRPIAIALHTASEILAAHNKQP